MANRLLLSVYVASAVKGERTLAKARVVASPAVQKFLVSKAPRLLENLLERNHELREPGRNKLLPSLKVANDAILYDVIPIVSANEWTRVEMYFSDHIITNAFKSERIHAWAEDDFCRRSGGTRLSHGKEWALLHHFVQYTGAEVCYNPLQDRNLHDLLWMVKQQV